MADSFGADSDLMMMGGSGRGKGGKGGKGLGKGLAKRHGTPKRSLGDLFGSALSKPSVKRLARRGGIKRISGLIQSESHNCLNGFLETVLHRALIYTEHRRAKTLTPLDVVYALKGAGVSLYGFGK